MTNERISLPLSFLSEEGKAAVYKTAGYVSIGFGLYFLYKGFKIEGAHNSRNGILEAEFRVLDD